MFIPKIGIDLGTTTVLVYVPKRGVIINEPSVVAVSAIDNKVLAVGKEAKDMLGRTPDTIIAHRPLKDGVIANYRMTEAMLRYFINKALGGNRLFRPEVMDAVPGGITSTERRAVNDATIRAGARAAYIIKEPIVAAIGASLPGSRINRLRMNSTCHAVSVTTSTAMRKAGSAPADNCS